jgi:hypothetical protein
MKWRWRVILPAIGLLVFSAVSYKSFRVDEGNRRASKKYFWWASIRLDSDPTNKRLPATVPCSDGIKGCANWDFVPDKWVDPGLLEIAYALSALPAFVSGMMVVVALGRLGISQVFSFLCLMPILISTWYYFLGWLLDRNIRRKSRPNSPAEL